MNYEIKRGYVKWTDEDGVFHKELLSDHPELLADADPAQQIAAEEAKRLNNAAEEFLEAREEDVEQDQWDTLHALQGAPADVLTANDLVAVDVDGEEIIVPADEAETANRETPASGAEEPVATDRSAVFTLNQPATLDPAEEAHAA